MLSLPEELNKINLSKIPGSQNNSKFSKVIRIMTSQRDKTKQLPLISFAIARPKLLSLLQSYTFYNYYILNK